MKQLRNLVFAGLFLPTMALVQALTLLLRLTRFKSWVRRRCAKRRRAKMARTQVLYLEVFFPENAGYHYRSYKWKEILDENGFNVEIKYIFEKEQFERLMREEKMVQFHLISLRHRLRHCLESVNYDCVIVRRELLHFNDYGDLFLEKFLLALHPNVILDFDDNIAAARREPRELSTYGRVMRESPIKFTQSLRLYRRFIVGSHYLKNLVQERNPRLAENAIAVIPTCVDYAQYPQKEYPLPDQTINFGWVGSIGNLRFLDMVTPALENLSKRYSLRLLVISGKEYQPDVSFEVVNLPWSLKHEIDNLRRIDVGFMPLHDTAVERGKCGFKLIQYMGLGIVSAASAVTINKEIVDDEVNGFLVHSPDEWEEVLEKALQRTGDFQAIGAAAHRTIRARYSFEGNQAAYLKFIGDSLL